MREEADVAKCENTQSCCSNCASTRHSGRRRVNLRLILELLRQVPYLIPRYFT